MNLFAGPILQREVVTSPRRYQYFLIRASYVALLFVLMYTIRVVAFGFQSVRSLGDFARYGSLVFQIFVIIQFALITFFALLFSTSSVAQEKDRKTLLILLMTDLSDCELVLGKLGSSLLMVMTLVLASAPAFFFIFLLGGIAPEQIYWSLTFCAASALAAGSWGSLVAFWREKTYQALAISVLGVLIFLGFVEFLVWVLGANRQAGAFIAAFDPVRALIVFLTPLEQENGISGLHTTGLTASIFMVVLSCIFTAITVKRLRVWNPSRSVHKKFREDEAEEKAVPIVRDRSIWKNPIIWREIKTRAYGRKTVLIKLTYILLAIAGFVVVYPQSASTSSVIEVIPLQGFFLIALCLVSLMLVNAQGVTSLTSERDQNTLELILMTDITAKEFVFGKLGGIFYNSKEMIAFPLIVVLAFAARGSISVENAIYFIVGFLSLIVFASMLGLHSGLGFYRSRAAISNSLGTMFFLFIGMFIFMLLLIEASGSFVQQFGSFLVFILLGSIALYASLSYRTPSSAFLLAAAMLPFFTFYAMTEFLLGSTLGVCLPIVGAYGFTTLSMLVPAVSEFDLALGRSTIERG